MKDKKFDDIIKNKLGQFQSNYNPESWDALHAKMDVENLEDSVQDEIFDKELNKRLDNYEVQYDESTWPILEDKLEHAAFLKRHVYIAKSAEAIIFLLLLFTFNHFYPLTSAISPTFKAVAEKINNELKESKLSSDEGNEPIAELNQIIKEEAELANVNFESNIIEAESNNSESSVIEFNDPKTRIANTISISQLPIQVIDQLVYAGDQNTSLELVPNTVIPVTTAAAPIAAVGSSLNTSMLSFSMAEKLLKPKNDKSLFLNGFATADVNWIKSPFDQIYNRQGYMRTALGMGIGVSLSLRSNNIEYEAGLSYSVKGYQPRIIWEHIGGASNFGAVSLSEIVFEISQLNLGIKKHFRSSNAWSFYLHGGSSLNLVMHSRYDIEERGKLPSPSLFASEDSNLKNKDFTRGFLEGGDFLKNAFFSVNLGFGLQKQVNKNTSIYFQPSYQHHVLDGGVGPNNDRINNFSFQIGSKVLIN